MLEVVAWGLGALVLLAGAVAAYASRRPDTFTVSRSAVIEAPADRIFGIITDFTRWPEWSPWHKLDPAMNTAISTPSSGVGAWSSWDGNGKVGAGRSEITRADAPSRIVIALHMERPFRAENTVEYTLVPDGAGTRVTWAMSGAQPLPAKIFSTFVDCAGMVGRDFERGLASLKSLAEH